MNISWKWLLEYVDYGGTLKDAVGLLTMAGLNVDSVEELPGGDALGDALLDVEVTSNRPDCLGHVGVARELAALTDSVMKIPAVDYDESGKDVAKLTSVEVLDSQGCPRYTARVIRGVKVGPSPEWLVERLEAVGLRAVNNVVDVTNFVLYERGQPLHAFDYDRLSENRIVVRRATAGEMFQAIDHTEHELAAGDLVIADARRAVAMAGVMGGADSEVTEQTVNVLLESAMFDPLSVRNTSRRTQLISDSSYRFERGVDFDGVDWASRRACQLILETAGGQAAKGAVDVRVEPPEPQALRLRYAQVPRVLGIDVPQEEVVRILKALGLEILSQEADHVEVRPPALRRDLTREIDLIEEIARIYGYDKVPYLASIPTVSLAANRREEVTRMVTETLIGAGHHEAVTVTLTDAQTAAAFSPGDDTPPLSTRDTAASAATFIRKSILPGLFQSKRNNQDIGRGEVAFFEIARAFRDVPGQAMPHEATHLALCTDAGPEIGAGVVQALAERLGLRGRLRLEPTGRVAELDPEWQADIVLDRQVIGFCGLLGEGPANRYKFRHVPWVAELQMDPLVEAANLRPRFSTLPQFPAIDRDLALIVDEGVLWKDLHSCVREAGIAELEDVDYVSLYRGKQIPAGKKCLAIRLRFRKADGTLTHGQADEFQDRILAATRQKLAAELRGDGG